MIKFDGICSLFYHRWLLYKLEYYGIRGFTLMSWATAFSTRLPTDLDLYCLSLNM